jgi:hypothetical protein
VKKRRRWLWGLAAIPLLALADYWLFPVFVTGSGRVVDRGENALWLRYTWYFGEHPPEDMAALAARLRDNGIRDAYFHVRSIQADGRLKYRYPSRARGLNDRLRKLAPTVRRIAWIYAGNANGLGQVRLEDPRVRLRMAREAAWLVREGGFDGVQWDYEICPDGDRGLLELLEETRAALPKGAFLGAAVPTWYPRQSARSGGARDTSARFPGVAIRSQ